MRGGGDSVQAQWIGDGVVDSAAGKNRQFVAGAFDHANARLIQIGRPAVGVAETQRAASEFGFDSRARSRDLEIELLRIGDLRKDRVSYGMPAKIDVLARQA